MNWRAIGCGGLAAAVFIGLGLLSMWLAFGNAGGCPEALQWDDRTYQARGTPAPSPALGDGQAVRIGSTFMGLATRQVFGPPGTSPSTQAEDRPELIALECGDGTYRAYRWNGVTLSPRPSASP